MDHISVMLIKPLGDQSCSVDLDIVILEDTPPGRKEILQHGVRMITQDSWRRRLGPYSVQSVGAAKAVSLAIGHNAGRVATPTQYTSKLALILPTSEG